MGYFDEVQKKTKTRFWINNPTLFELQQAIKEGAKGCTTNPSYVSKLLQDPIDKEIVIATIKDLLLIKSDITEIAEEVQRRMVMRLAKELMPLYEKSNGTEGFVTIQSNPEHETEPDFLISDGLANKSLSPNIVIKVPVTKAGLASISTFFENNCAVMATEVMTLSQATSVWNAYEENVKKTGLSSTLFVTHITGIQDDFFKATIAADDIPIPNKLISYAGLSIAKTLYQTWKEEGKPGRLIGGGARKLEDFTELVGADIDITVNWKGTAKVLIEEDPEVVERINYNIDKRDMVFLKENLPGYKEAIELDGLPVEKYFEYGGVELFRNSFLSGWKTLKDLIKEMKGDHSILSQKNFGNINEPRVMIRPGLERVTLTYNETLQMCYFYIKKGSKLEMHKHVPIQNGIVANGKVKFITNEGELILEKGEAYLFNSNFAHGLETLEDTELIECFSPTRDEYKVEKKRF